MIQFVIKYLLSKMHALNQKYFLRFRNFWVAIEGKREGPLKNVKNLGQVIKG